MRQESLFENEAAPAEKEDALMLRPLADRMRPETLQEYAGQSHLIYPGSLLWKMIENDSIPSMIFWGPPGVGKTTLASIIAKQTNSWFVTFSGAASSIKEIKELMKEAEERRKAGQRTLVFVDEIHRFNKAQQDAFLPYVEKGSIVLIGATTENPSFEVNSALLSRCKTFVLKPLQDEDIEKLLRQALNSPKGFGTRKVFISDAVLHNIALFAHGDGRLALNTLEMIVSSSPDDLDGVHVDEDTVKQVLGQRTLLYDKKGDRHFDMISALHKSMRNSDVQACIYWLARMLEGGEDPLYIARRMVRMASEDIGMADSRALEITVAAYQACMYLGMPECSVHLTHAITYLALAPKSNALETAYFAARDAARETMEEPVPLHLCNAPTKLMKDLGYSHGYEYSHDYEMHMTDMECLPKRLLKSKFYQPSNFGSEAKVQKRMEAIDQTKAVIRKNKNKHEKN
ncbi:MAG: replication-associated recombination protein A [Ileibacterium sp.]|nr:replication-associated recombination protein A [Ileibacterium sp.]